MTKAVALALTAVLSVGMLAVGTTAASAAGTPTITATEIPDGGGAVTITGTGFDPNSVGIYLGAAAQGLPNFYAAGISAGDSVWVNVGNETTATRAPMASDGSFTVTLTLPADDGAKKWAIYTSKAHGGGFTDASQNASTNLVYTAPVVVEPPVVEPPVVEPPVVDPPVTPATPAITVTEIPDGGGAVTINGSGFAPTAIGIYVTAAPQGYANLYATPSAERLTSVAVNTGYTEPTATRAVLNADGTFTTTITFPADTGTKWAIYTSIARNGGITDPSQNTIANLTYTAPVVVEPPVTEPPVTEPPVTEPPTTDPVATTPETVAVGTGKLGYAYTDLAGGTVTVTGSGFSPTSPGIYIGLAPRGFSNFYAAASAIYQNDVVHVAVGNADATTGMGRTAPMNADGTFTVTLAVPAGTEPTARIAAAAVAGAVDSTWAIYTSKAHGGGFTDPSQNAVLNFVYQLEVSSAQVPVIGEPVPTTPVVATPEVVAPTVPVVDTAAAPAAETCVARSVSGATLNWAIKDSFRSYITGGIANGSWNLSSVGDSNGQFVWSNGSGSINTEATRGTVSFPGTVHFTGHDGALDITITNVKLRFAGSAATLTASFDSLALDGTRTTQSNVAFANVAAGSVSVTGSRLSLNGAATTLTTAGATAFGDFYDAGAALAPLSLVAPLGATVPCTEATFSSLAATGTDTLGGGLLIAALLVMTGFGGMSLARRRRANTTTESSMI